MYHPAPPPANSPFAAADFEFVEIQNTGTNTINLAGARLSGPIDFTFAPSQLTPLGADATNDFEGGPNATRFVASTLGSPPGPYLTNDGPSGALLCLLNSSTNPARNRLAFNQTSTSGDRVIADFDFRASCKPSTVVAGNPTSQNFDTAGTPYTLTHSGTTAPIVFPADSGSTGRFLRLVRPTAANWA